MKPVRDPLVQWISDSWVTDPAQTAEHVVFSVLNLPFDYAVSFRPGTRFGPAGLLAALNGLSLYCTDKRVCLDHVRLHDLGEVDALHELKASYQAIADAVASIPRAAKPVFLGGDHSVTDPIIRGLLRRSPASSLGIVVLDAHLDSRTPIPGREHSGHWVRTLADVVDYRRVAQLGINAAIYSESYMRAAEESGILVRTPYEIRRAGWPETIAEVVDHVTEDTDAVYISVDIDCLDQAFAPGTSVTNPCGLQPHEVIDAVYAVSKATHVCGIDVVEVSPPLDERDFSSQVGAHVLLNHFAGVVARQRGG